MTTTLTQQPSPDYGEPFALPLHYDPESDWGFIREASNALACVVRRPLDERDFAEYRRTGNDPMEPRANRIVSCVNACAGMADPDAEIQAMRTAIKRAYRALEVVYDCNLAFGQRQMVNQALDKLLPFLKP